MIDLTSTPIIILVILGSVGVALPVVSIALKERPSMISYGIATLIALFAAIGYVLYQLALDHVAPAAIFSQDVLVDDAFGALCNCHANCCNIHYSWFIQLNEKQG